MIRYRMCAYAIPKIRQIGTASVKLRRVLVFAQSEQNLCELRIHLYSNEPTGDSQANDAIVIVISCQGQVFAV